MKFSFCQASIDGSRETGTVGEELCCLIGCWKNDWQTLRPFWSATVVSLTSILEVMIASLPSRGQMQHGGLTLALQTMVAQKHSFQLKIHSQEEHLMVNTDGRDMKHTRFFVEDILRPDFGKGNTHPVSPDSHRGGSPSSSPEHPGSQGSEPHRQNEGEGKVNLWPAWVYCTRYSDRPSAGKPNTILYSVRRGSQIVH